MPILTGCQEAQMQCSVFVPGCCQITEEATKVTLNNIKALMH